MCELNEVGAWVHEGQRQIQRWGAWDETYPRVNLNLFNAFPSLPFSRPNIILMSQKSVMERACLRSADSYCFWGQFSTNVFITHILKRAAWQLRIVVIFPGLKESSCCPAWSLNKISALCSPQRIETNDISQIYERWGRCLSWYQWGKDSARPFRQTDNSAPPTVTDYPGVIQLYTPSSPLPKCGHWQW